MISRQDRIDPACFFKIFLQKCPKTDVSFVPIKEIVVYAEQFRNLSIIYEGYSVKYIIDKIPHTAFESAMPGSAVVGGADISALIQNTIPENSTLYIEEIERVRYAITPDGQLVVHARVLYKDTADPEFSDVLYHLVFALK